MKALCKSGFLTGEALKEACERIEINLTNEQLEYIITKLFEYSDSINKLSIDRLFEVFSSKPKPLPKEDDFDSRSNLQSEPNAFTASPIVRVTESRQSDKSEEDEEEEGSDRQPEEADEEDEDEEEEQKIGHTLDVSKEEGKTNLRISERREEEEEDSNLHGEEYSENEFNDEERSPQAARDLRLKLAMANDVR